MPDIFLSYNREDQAVARRFAEAFAAHGFDVWWDATLKSGEAYDEVTETALRTAKAVVVLWSPRSVVSRWVRAEATLAHRNKTLVPCTIEPCDRPIMFELTQTADLSHWQGDVADKAWVAFLGDVRRFVGKEAAPVAEPVIAAPLPLPSKPSIAVMPFANLSGDPDQEYFADGMVLEITNALTRFKSLFVIASGSSLSFKGKGVTPQDAARQLGVRYVLEGSVRKGGNRVRIAVQLIDAADGAQVWNERFDDTLEDIFELQDKVALAVAGRIGPTIQMAEMSRAASQQADVADSYDLLLRAMASWRAFGKPSFTTALELVHRAIDLQPGMGTALGFAAWCHAWMFAAGWSDQPSDDQRQAIDLGRRALEAASDDPEVLALVADALVMTGGGPQSSLDLVDRALSLNPGHAFAHFLRGVYLVLKGRTEEGLLSLETSLRIDPIAYYRGPQLCWLSLGKIKQRRFEEAVALLVQSTQLMPNYIWAHQFLAACYGHLGQPAKARAARSAYEKAVIGVAPGEDAAIGDVHLREILLEGYALAEFKPPGSPAEPATS